MYTGTPAAEILKQELQDKFKEERRRKAIEDYEKRLGLGKPGLHHVAVSAKLLLDN